MITQFQAYRAIYNPKTRSFLRDGADKYIGKESTFRAIWIIENGKFIHQWAFATPRDWTELTTLGWVPEEDLTLIRTDHRVLYRRR